MTLLISILVIFLNYNQNKKRNKLEIITKANMTSISELRIIFSNYIQNIYTMNREKYYEDYFKIKLYLNTEKTMVNAIIKKIDICNDVVNYILDYKKNINTLLEVFDKMTEIQLKEMNSILESLGLHYENIEELKKTQSNKEEVKIISNIITDQLNKGNELLIKLFESINKNIEKENDRLNAIKENFSKKIDEINKELCNEMANHASYLFFPLPVFNGNFNDYLNDLVKNVAESMNDYLNIELSRNIDSVK